MDKRHVLKIIEQFRLALQAHGITATRIVLFGSYATGRQHEWSDIDLVVISEDFADKDYWERIEILSDAIYEVHQPIEAIAKTPKEWDSGRSLIVEFAKEGEQVYPAMTGAKR